MIRELAFIDQTLSTGAIKQLAFTDEIVCRSDRTW